MTRRDFSWPIPASITARLAEGSFGRQRAIAEEKHLLLVLHRPPDPKNPRQRDGLLALRLPDSRWMADGSDSGEFQLNRLLTDYEEISEQMATAYQKADDALDYVAILRRVIPVARAAGNLREALQAGRELVRNDRLLLRLRDRSYEVARALELLRDDCRLSLDAVQARKAEEEVTQNAQARELQSKLNRLAAFTFPLMAISTIFGMNLSHGLESVGVGLFWLVAFACLCIGLLLGRWAR